MSPHKKPIGFALLGLCVAVGALLDALLLGAVLGWGFVARLLHGAVVTLYAIENWALLEEVEAKASALLIQTDARDEALRCIQQLKEEVTAQTEVRRRLEEENQRLLCEEAPWRSRKTIEHWNQVWHSSTDPRSPPPANEFAPNCRHFTTPCAAAGR